MAGKNAKTIRSDIVTRLTGNTDAGSRVYSGRILPQKASALPAINVWIPDRAGENRDPDGSAYVTEYRVQIEVLVSLSTFADDIDDILYQIKNTLFTDSAFYSQYEDVGGYSESITFNAEGEKPTATATLIFDITSVEIWN